MEEKYIELLIKKCTELEKHPILFVHYSKEIEPFVEKLIKKVKAVGNPEVYLDGYNPNEIHEFLLNHSIQEIETAPYFDHSIWDVYAKKRACFLIFETEYPHLMDDISAEKIAVSSKRARDTKSLYRHMVEQCELSWCIAPYPGECWAKDLFAGKDGYQKLKQAIYHICMVDQKNPITSWENYLKKTKAMINYLNTKEFVQLHYTNSLGTDLELFLPDGYLFSNAEDRQVIVNMPSYEVFTSPCFDKTKGIVYNSKPLYFNGVMIDGFFLKFEQGKVVEMDAKVGKEMLQKIIESDENSCYLGECAFVEEKSPIASMNLVFKTTLIDENASCHLALGAGFPECIKDGFTLTEEELLKKGINVSKTHVDFMIGTSDLNIIGTTKKGEHIPILVNGNFDRTLLEKVGSNYEEFFN